MLSIVTIFYNSAQFIDKCVESFGRQTNRDFEVVFVNDGSTDTSEEVLRMALGNRDFRHKIVSHPVNYGISVARNTGLDHVGGEIVSFVDSDDFVSPAYVETILANHRRHPVDLMVFGINKYNIALESGEDSYLDADARSFTLEEFLARKGADLPGHYYVQFVYRKSTMDTHRLRFFPGCSPGEDVEFMLKYLCYVETIFSVPDVLYTYIIHGGNVTSRGVARYNYHYWGITQRLQSWIEAHPELPEERRRIVRMGIGKYYRRLLANSWKYGIREFRARNPRVRDAFREILRYPYADGKSRMMYRALLTFPSVVALAYKIKNAVKKT